MTVTQRLMKPGSFTVTLKDSAPWSAWDAVDGFDHIVITPTRLEPIDSFSDANILASSIFTGVATKKYPRTFEGYDLSWWLGSPDGIGDLLTSAVTRTTGTLSQWVGDLRPSSLSAGTVTNTGAGSVTATFQWVTRREALDAVCRAAGAEWRVNPNGTLDAAIASTLFTSAPTVVVTRYEEGNDGAYEGLSSNGIDALVDVEQYTTKAVVLGQGVGTSTIQGISTVGSAYKDLLNGSVVGVRLASSPADAQTNADVLAAALTTKYNSAQRSVTLTSATHTVRRNVEAGDYVWVFDLLNGVVDPANQIQFRGELIAPLKMRVLSLSWPIQRGMGVYARRSGATPVYTDLTDFVEFESDEVSWELGTAVRFIGDELVDGNAAYLGANPTVVERASDVNRAPAGVMTTASTGSSQTGISAVTDLTSLSGAITGVAGRRYLITGLVNFRQRTATGAVTIEIVHSGSTVLASWVETYVTDAYGTAHFSMYHVPGAGSITYKLRAKTSAGTVDINPQGLTTIPSMIIVEDVGV